MIVRMRAAVVARVSLGIAWTFAAAGCAPASPSSSSSSSGSSASAGNEHSSGDHASTAEGAGGSGGGASSSSSASSNASGASGSGGGAATPTTSAPAAPAFPPPPTWSEVETALRSSSQGARCFQHNVIRANLAEAYADADFDGNGHPERIWQLPDCLLVVTQGASHWEFPVMVQRRIPPETDNVRLRAVQRDGATLLEVRDERDEPRTRDSYRFRWTGTDLVPVP